MIEVPIDRIIPVNEARSQFDRIMNDIQGDNLYVVINKDGKPSAAIINIDYLEKVTGDTRPKMVGVEGPTKEETIETVTSETQTPQVPTENITEEAETSSPQVEETPVQPEDMPITSAPPASKVEEEELPPESNKAIIDALEKGEGEVSTPSVKEESNKSDQIKTLENPFGSPTPGGPASDEDKINEMEI